MTLSTIPQHILQSLIDLGYDFRPELGDRIINQSDQDHCIYIQVRESRRTYIPITITHPIAIEPIKYQNDNDVFVDTLETQPETKAVLTPADQHTLDTSQVWDQNIQELIQRIDSARKKIHTIIHQ